MITEQYQKVKIIYSHCELDFDTGRYSDTVIEEVQVDFAEAKSVIERLESLNDGESNYQVLLVYDLYDKVKYSKNWILGRLE